MKKNVLIVCCIKKYINIVEQKNKIMKTAGLIFTILLCVFAQYEGYRLGIKNGWGKGYQKGVTECLNHVKIKPEPIRTTRP